jgi:hypothetical protein
MAEITRKVAKARCPTEPLRPVPAGERVGFIPCPVSIYCSAGISLEGFPHAMNSNFLLEVELENEKDGVCGFFRSSFSELHFGCSGTPATKKDFPK